MAEYIQRTKRRHIWRWIYVDMGSFLRLVEDALSFDATVIVVLAAFDSKVDHVTPFDAPLALYMSPSFCSHSQTRVGSVGRKHAAPCN